VPGGATYHDLLFQLVSTIAIQLSMLDQYKADIIIISLKCNLHSPYYSKAKISLVVKQQLLKHSLHKPNKHNIIGATYKN